MKVRMLTSLSGPSYSVSTGEVGEFDQETGERLIAAGLAAPVVEAKSKKKAEKAVKE